MTESDTRTTDVGADGGTDGPARREADAAAFRIGSGPSDRRTVLRRAGLVALIGGGAAGLAACGGNNSAGTPSAGPASSQAPSEAPASSSTPSSSASSSGGGSSAAEPTGFKVAASEVPEGGGVITGDFVVTQPSAGSYKAFSKICTHQKCPVGSVRGGLILCPCHGSKFSITDGSVQGGPAPSPLASKTVTKSGSDLFVS